MPAHTLTAKKSLTIPRDLVDEAEARSGPRGLSAYVARALAAQLELDRLADYAEAAEAELGPVPDEVRAQVHADLAAADAEIGFNR